MICPSHPVEISAVSSLPFVIQASNKDSLALVNAWNDTECCIGLDVLRFVYRKEKTVRSLTFHMFLVLMHSLTRTQICVPPLRCCTKLLVQASNDVFHGRKQDFSSSNRQVEAFSAEMNGVQADVMRFFQMVCNFMGGLHCFVVFYFLRF